MLAWRMSKAKRSEDLTGTGAALNGGRWNNVNDAALYMGLTHAITVLEILVHLNGAPSSDMKSVSFELPDDPSLYLQPAISELPTDWKRLPTGKQSMDFGSKWLKSNSHLGLIIPSAISPMSLNLMINPNHPAAAQIRIKEERDFDLDPRLLALLLDAEKQRGKLDG